MARRSTHENEAIAGVLRVLPAKWLVGLLIAVVVYFFLQPRLNQWFGWSLPSLAAMAGNEPPAKAAKPSTSQAKVTAPSKASATKEAPSSDSSPNRRGTSSKTQSGSKTAENDYKYRILKPVGKDRYESPAGLIYAPGSEEGHRLAHIERHLQDQPQRPGSHGVFDGDMASFLVAIDDAYKRARGHNKGTKSRVEDGMTIYEAPFDQAIGYLGGTEGARKKNPKLKKMRLVVRDRNLITAFPIQ
jgi:hypothetical protein